MQHLTALSINMFFFSTFGKSTALQVQKVTSWREILYESGCEDSVYVWI